MQTTLRTPQHLIRQPGGPVDGGRGRADSTRPPCRYFSVCLYNRWLESLDYVHHSVFYNHTCVRRAPTPTLWSPAAD